MVRITPTGRPDCTSIVSSPRAWWYGPWRRRPASPRRPPGAPIDHQVVRSLRDLRVQVVHQHSQRASAAQLFAVSAAPRGACTGRAPSTVIVTFLWGWDSQAGADHGLRGRDGRATGDQLDGDVDLRVPASDPSLVRARRPRGGLRSTARWRAPARAERAARCRGRRSATRRRAPGSAVHGPPELTSRGPAHRHVVRIAELGMESTEAGPPAASSRHDGRRSVVGDHVAGVDARVLGQERGRPELRADRGNGRSGARRCSPGRPRRWPGSRADRRAARRGSCRSTPRARPG